MWRLTCLTFAILCNIARSFPLQSNLILSARSAALPSSSRWSSGNGGGIGGEGSEDMAFRALRTDQSAADKPFVVPSLTSEDVIVPEGSAGNPCIIKVLGVGGGGGNAVNRYDGSWSFFIAWRYALFS